MWAKSECQGMPQSLIWSQGRGSPVPLEDLGNILLAAAHIKYFYVNTAIGEKSGEVLARLWSQDA